MEMVMTSLASPTILVPLVIIIGCAWKVMNWLWLKPRKLDRQLREQGLSGNPYSLSRGDLKESFKAIIEASTRTISLSDDFVPRVLYAIPQIIEKYGKNSFLWVGLSPKVVIVEPDLVKDVFTKFNEFQKIKSGPSVRFITRGIVGLEGKKWETRRKIINPAFHQEKLKHMLPVFLICCNEMFNKWENLISKDGTSELDIWPDLQILTSDVISRTAFGSNYEEGRKIFQLLKEQAALVMQSFQAVFPDYIPGWRFLPTKLNRRMNAVDREVTFRLKEIISKREAEHAPHDNLLGLMMESNAEEINQCNDKNDLLTVKDIIEECKLFYFAGQETTSSALVWTMVMLSKHQEWQARARDEVLQVFGKEKPDFEGLSRLKIVTSIIYEVLRLYPPVITLSRTIHKEVKLGRLSLPSGVEICLPIILIHRDPELWGDDAKEFKPERFSEGVFKATKGQLSFFPFGWGPRICVGQNFALLESKLALSMILQHFTFELSPSYAHAPLLVLTLQPQHGAHIVLHKL